MTVHFAQPAPDGRPAHHHAVAAAANVGVVSDALATLDAVLVAGGDHERILLRAAAGAGKSFALVRMVEHALEVSGAECVAVTAFTNKQVQPLAMRLAERLGRDAVALLAARSATVPDDVIAAVTVVTQAPALPETVRVVVGTAHRLGSLGEKKRLLDHLGGTDADPKSPFDVLFVDEAWQMADYLFDTVKDHARIVVGVGDVGQLPPLDPGENPWRGDPKYNPYRAWPTAFDGEARTWSVDLPTVWRPPAEQLPLWRAFYSDWDELHSVAAPGDRAIVTSLATEPAASVWRQVGSCRPTLLEVDGLEEPDSPDIDLPLLGVAERLLDELLAAGFALREMKYDNDGSPLAEEGRDGRTLGADPTIVILATRNQAVDDAQAVVDRLVARHGLPDGLIRASTVDSWQGQTNGITIAIHPLSGAAKLDEFNSAFGRLAVACTRATHGLLLLARAGLDELLQDAPARPGTPFGEPGPRSLPRQTHERIINVMARGTLDASTLLTMNQEGPSL